MPKIDLVKKINNKTNLDGNFLLKSNNFIKSFQTNILEKVNINDFIFNSNPKITQSGFYNNYDFIIKNINTDSNNSDNYKEDRYHYLSGLFQFNSSLPLIKEEKGLFTYFETKLALKLSPDFMKDLSKDGRNRLDVNNIYNLNRLSKNDTLEAGGSLTLGNDFSILTKNNAELFGLKLANNIRLDKNDDLPRNNQLGVKIPIFLVKSHLHLIKIITTKYNASAKNNLTDINYENFTTQISINNFVTTFDYLNENSNINPKSYLTNRQG